MVDAGKFYTRKTKGYNNLWFMPLGFNKNAWSVYLLRYNTKTGAVEIDGENPNWIADQDDNNRLEEPNINSIPVEDQKFIVRKLFRRKKW